MTEFSRFNDSEDYFLYIKNEPPWCYPVRSPISELYPYNIKLFIPCQHFFQIFILSSILSIILSQYQINIDTFYCV
nr:MAG TPA: hypothetical protein [Caudoviricetes sp.]